MSKVNITFSEDIQLPRATASSHTEPSYCPTIFDQEIDADVDNPEICHDHSELPEKRPKIVDILSVRESVCKRIATLLRNPDGLVRS